MTRVLKRKMGHHFQPNAKIIYRLERERCVKVPPTPGATKRGRTANACQANKDSDPIETSSETINSHKNKRENNDNARHRVTCKIGMTAIRKQRAVCNTGKNFLYASDLDTTHSARNTFYT